MLRLCAAGNPPLFLKAWPDLTTEDDEAVRREVEQSGRLLVRAITWNQQAQVGKGDGDATACVG